MPFPARGPRASSLLGSCAGLSAQSADIRHPSVSWKGDKVVFAARSSENEPFAIWTVNVDGERLPKNTLSTGPPAPRVGATTARSFTTSIRRSHPTTASCSRRRAATSEREAFDYQRPAAYARRSPRWNANLYVSAKPSGASAPAHVPPEQGALPVHDADGRLIFTAEKRAPGFYQLAAGA